MVRAKALSQSRLDGAGGRAERDVTELGRRARREEWQRRSFVRDKVGGDGGGLATTEGLAPAASLSEMDAWRAITWFTSYQITRGEQLIRTWGETGRRVRKKPSE